jgi:hypothetical protein
MSGLILEGDLEKKFGKNFPTPIIDQVVVFDDRLEVDISIYFRLPDGDSSDAMEFLRVFDSQELQIVVGAPKKLKYMLASGGRSGTNDYSVTNDAFGMLSDSKIFSPPVNINSVDFEKDINIYTNTGQRYCRLKTTITLDLVISDIQRVIQNIIAFTYSKNIYSFFSPVSDNLGNFLDDYQNLKSSFINVKEQNIDELNLLSTQTSDISHVKVFNSAGGIEQTKINVFLDENEQVYSGQVLYSLARTYHKAVDFTKETIETGVKAIVSNYEQIVSEDTPLEDSMNNILFLLETEKDDPKLLTVLNDANKASPYKSSAMPVGKFYKDLNTFFFESNRRVIAQEELTLRQFDNVNIVDFREVDLPQEVIDSEFYYQEESDLIFITKEMCVRGLSDFNGADQAVSAPTNLNDTLFFVDVDKAIAEKSEISKFVNTTFINVLFNNKDINNFFFPSEVMVKKSSSPLVRFGGISQFTLDPITKHLTYEIFEAGKRNQTSCGYFYNPDRGEIRLSFLSERNVHLNRREVEINSRNYVRDIRTYNIFEGGDGLKWDDDYYYHITVKFTDNTMTFYDYAIRRRYLDILNKLRRYEDLADDFCSSNDLDGSFNDFFKNSIEAHFSEPYPWVEAPYFYTLIYQLLLREGRPEGAASYPFEDGEIQVPNLTALRSLAFEITDGISPNSGNLNNLRNFVITMEQLYSRNLAQGNGLDSENEIYLEDSDYEIKKPEIVHTKVKSFELPKTLSFGVEFYDLLNYAYISNFKNYSVSTNAEDVIISDIEFFDLRGFMEKYEEFGGQTTFRKIFHEFISLYRGMASAGGEPSTQYPLRAAFGLDPRRYKEQMSGEYTASGIQSEFAEDIRAALRYYFSLATLEMSTGPKYEDMFSLFFLTYLQYVQDGVGAPSGNKEGMDFIFTMLSSMRGSQGYDEFIEFVTESDLYLENTIWFAEKYNKFDLLEDLVPSDDRNPDTYVSSTDPDGEIHSAWGWLRSFNKID